MKRGNMPNHIINRIEAPAKIIEQLIMKDENGNSCFDFNTFIPTPAHVIQGSLEVGKTYPQETWLEFNTNNWGTKWNAYSFVQESDTVITFETAWNDPFPVIAAMSRKHPETDFIVSYSDEDYGHNLGIYMIKNGEITQQTLFDDETIALMFANVMHDKAYDYHYVAEDIGYIRELAEQEPENTDLQEELDELEDVLEDFTMGIEWVTQEHSDIDFNIINDYLLLKR